MQHSGEVNMKLGLKDSNAFLGSITDSVPWGERGFILLICTLGSFHDSLLINHELTRNRNNETRLLGVHGFTTIVRYSL